MSPEDIAEEMIGRHAALMTRGQFVWAELKREIIAAIKGVKPPTPEEMRRWFASLSDVEQADMMRNKPDVPLKPEPRHMIDHIVAEKSVKPPPAPRPADPTPEPFIDEPAPKPEPPAKPAPKSKSKSAAKA